MLRPRFISFTPLRRGSEASPDFGELSRAADLRLTTLARMNAYFGTLVEALILSLEIGAMKPFDRRFLNAGVCPILVFDGRD